MNLTNLQKKRGHLLLTQTYTVPLFLQTFAAPADSATKRPQSRQPPTLHRYRCSSRQSPRVWRQRSQGTNSKMCQAGCRLNDLKQAYWWQFKWQALQLLPMRIVKKKEKREKKEKLNQSTACLFAILPAPGVTKLRCGYTSAKTWGPAALQCAWTDG